MVDSHLERLLHNRYLVDDVEQPRQHCVIVSEIWRGIEYQKDNLDI